MALIFLFLNKHAFSYLNNNICKYITILSDKKVVNKHDKRRPDSQGIYRPLQSQCRICQMSGKCDILTADGL